jgi:aminoglycoside phosphotransferase (APT) family kinase protein
MTEKTNVLHATPPAAALQWVVDSTVPGGRIASVRSLGGRWLACHGVDVIDRHGRERRLVLRRWVRPGWDEDDPDFTAEQEARTLSLVAGARVPAPALVAADVNGEVCDAPALLTTRVPGHPPRRPRDFASFLAQLADALAVIHSIDGRAQRAMPGFRRYYDVARVAVPVWTSQPKLWERALSIAAEPPPEGRLCFIHRDYHHHNTLWMGGRLTGIVDWTAASWGPAAVDVGHMRWNLAGEYSVDVADGFLAAHASVLGEGFTDQVYWDVATLIDVIPEIDQPSPDDVERLESYLSSLIARL